LTSLCLEHFRLTLRVESFAAAAPGQFVHISPPRAAHPGYPTHDEAAWRPSAPWMTDLRAPMLRRAFSIAGLREVGGATEIDVVFRVVGKGTRWMASLRAGDSVSVLGPLGNRFDIRTDRAAAWLVAGGVGLPPMLWLAEALARAGRAAVAFCGAQSRALLALGLDDGAPPAVDAGRATRSAVEFNRQGTPVVIATDDGTYGFPGHIGAAMSAHHAANPVPPNDLIVYTCGPERMMEYVATYCVARGIECQVCMERAMACGTGMCQSCVIAVRETDANGTDWRYRLCCTEGPVFPAGRVIFGDPTSA